MRRLLDFGRGLAGIIGGLALLVGVPWLLVTLVGWPFPSELPEWVLVERHVLDGSVPAPFLLKGLALVAWFLWSQLVVALLTEMLAAGRGRLAGRAPVLPGIQTVAAKFIASVLLFLSALSPPRGAGAAPLESVVGLVTDEVGSVAARSSWALPGLVENPSVVVDHDDEVVEVLGQPVKADGLVYQVEDGDSWWGVAERLTGDGLRWRELRDLNVGREVAPGVILQAEREELAVGWRLLPPSDSDRSLLISDAERSLLTNDADLAPDGAVTALRVESGDTLWDLADSELGDATRWPEIYERSKDVAQPNGRVIDNPDVIWPGDTVLIPDGGVSESAPESTDTALEPDETVLTSDDTAPESTDTAPESDETVLTSDAAATESDDAVLVRDGEVDVVAPDDGSAVEPVAEGDQDVSVADRAVPSAGLALGSGAFLLATGTIGLLHRLRRLRRSNLGAGVVPAPPPLELIEVETVLRGASDEDRLARVEQVARSLADLATPEFLRLRDDRAEVVVDESVGVARAETAPWVPIPVVDGSALPGGRRALALLGPAFASADPERETVPRLPGLVTIGRGLFANLEALGVVAVEGSSENVAALVRSMVLELATGALEGDRHRVPQVRVSFALPGTDVYPNVRCGPLARIEAELGGWIEQAELALAAAGSANGWPLRARASNSLPPPVILVVGEADLATDNVLADFVEQARSRRLPLAVVLVADPDRRVVEPNVVLTVSDDEITVGPHGLVAGRHGLDEELLVGVESLIDHARRAPLMPRPEPAWDHPGAVVEPPPEAADPATPVVKLDERAAQIDIETVLPSAAVEVTDQAVEVDHGLLIRVLGPVQMEGGPWATLPAPDDRASESDSIGQAVAAAEEAELSVLTFLALSGPTALDRVAEAVWPGDGQATMRAQQTLTGLLGHLGPLLVATDDGRYRLRSTATDLGAARRLIDQARRVEPVRAMNLLHTALAEVRGRPFEGADPRLWQWLEDHRGAVTTQATSLLLDACFDLCDLAWEANDPALAGWACEVAANLEPLQETVATRRAQILVGSGRIGEAAAVVKNWEASVSQLLGRPAPLGPRSVLPAMGASATEIEEREESEHVG